MTCSDSQNHVPKAHKENGESDSHPNPEVSITTGSSVGVNGDGDEAVSSEVTFETDAPSEGGFTASERVVVFEGMKIEVDIHLASEVEDVVFNG